MLFSVFLSSGYPAACIYAITLNMRLPRLKMIYYG